MTVGERGDVVFPWIFLMQTWRGQTDGDASAVGWRFLRVASALYSELADLQLLGWH